MNIQELKINPEFETVIPPLGEKEFEQLEKNILHDKEVFTPIFTWNGFIVDGHHRYKILQKHPEILYRIVEKAFVDGYAALSWICDNQLGRRNLTPEQKKYLIGERLEAEKQTHGGNRKSELVKSSVQNEHLIFPEKTSERIARETNTTVSYVRRAGEYAKGINAAEKVLPGIKAELLSGSIKPTDKEVAAIAKANESYRLQMAEALRTAEDERRKEAQRKRGERAAKRTMMNEIDRLAAEHGNMDRPPVSIESHLQSFALTAERFLGTCDSYFADVPELITNEHNRAGIIVTGEKFIQYFTKIKENRYEPYII